MFTEAQGCYHNYKQKKSECKGNKKEMWMNWELHIPGCAQKIAFAMTENILNAPESPKLALGRRKTQLTAISFIWQALFIQSCGQIKSLSLQSLNVIGKFAKVQSVTHSQGFDGDFER